MKTGAPSCPPGVEFAHKEKSRPRPSTFCAERESAFLRITAFALHFLFILISLFLFTLETFRNLSKDGKGLYLTKMEVSCLLLPEIGHHPTPPFLT